MTPERWQQIGDLFHAAIQVEPAKREAWLGAACGRDDDLRAEVSRLLNQDEQLDRDGVTRRLPDDRRVMREPPTAQHRTEDDEHPG